MRCDRAEKLLPRYLEDALSLNQQHSVEQHLAGCDRCRAALRAQQRALRVLDRAPAPHPGIDLWAGLQQKIAADQQRLGRRITCAAVQERLPAFVESELSDAQQRLIHAHLHGCGACAAERRVLEATLRLLDEAGAAPPPSDLWPALDARLQADAAANGAGLHCGKARDLLPAYAATELAERPRRRISAHLDACPACARDLARLNRALARIDALPVVPPSRDLWPELQRRLAADPPTRRRPTLPALRPAFAGGLGAALLAGAAAIGLFFFRGPATPIEPPAAPTTVAQAPITAPVVAIAPAEAASQPVVAPTPPARRAARAAPPSAPAVDSPAAPSTTVGQPDIELDETLFAKVSAPMQTHLRFDEFMLRGPSEAAAPLDAPAETNTEDAYSAVMPEVVTALEQFVQVSDAVSSPFGSSDVVQ